MFGWLKSLFAGVRYFFATRNSPRTTPVPNLPQESHSNCRLEQLKPFECAYIAHGFAHPNGSQCPDCKEGPLLPGHEDTSARDFICKHCGAEFRLNLFSQDVFGERVTPRGHPEPLPRQKG
jgi:hypothetical protein